MATAIKEERKDQFGAVAGGLQDSLNALREVLEMNEFEAVCSVWNVDLERMRLDSPSTDMVAPSVSLPDSVKQPGERSTVANIAGHDLS